MKCPKIELGIVIACLRRLFVVVGHFLIGRGVGKGSAGRDQQSGAAGHDDNCPLQGRRNCATKSWPQ
jgi:hypothetical protein